MSKDIKIRQIRKDVKVLDKAVIVTDRIKHVCVRSKDRAEEAQGEETNTPVEYAENKVSNGVKTVSHESAHQI